MKIDLKQPILDKNDRLAADNRALFKEKGVFVLDLALARRPLFLRRSKRCATNTTSPSSKAILPATSMPNASVRRALRRCKSTRVARAISKAT